MIRTASTLMCVVAIASCTVDEHARRKRNIAKLEKLLARVSPEEPAYPDWLYQLGYTQFEEATSLRGARTGDEPERLTLSARANFDRVLKEYRSYSRLDEVRFWRADTMSFLSDWSAAADAWRAVLGTQQPGSKNADCALFRLHQALEASGQCAEAFALVPHRPPNWPSVGPSPCR